MFSVLILEDDLIQQEAIAHLLKSRHEDWTIHTARNCQQAKNLLSAFRFQLFLLDIKLSANPKDTQGLDFGRHIRCLPRYRYVPIIFLTALPDKVLPALQETHCNSYLIKPFKESAFFSAIDYAVDSVEEEESPLMIKDFNGVFQKVLPSSIIYLEALGKNIILHTDTYAITIANSSFSKMLSILPSHFVQCHRKYIINCNQYTSYDRATQFIHLNQSVLPVGRKYKDALERKIHI